MKILHIACVNNDPCSGVDVVVPEHVRAQSKLADVCFLNVTNKIVKGVTHQYVYKKGLTLDEIAPDLAVFHEAYRIEYLELARELERKNIPYIIIPHGELNSEAQKKKRLKKWAANLLLFNRFIEKAAALQMLSQRELESTKHGRLKFIGTNGINIPERHKKDFNADRTAFVYIGRLDPYHKGLDLMLDGVALCADLMRKRGCTLDIYGPDRKGEGAKIRKMIDERRLSNIVSLHPAVSGREKENALLSADVFIQTSRFEGMPMGILEALGYGLPCLLSDGTTLAPLVDDYDAGWRCRGDAQSIADAIKRAIAERQSCTSLSRNARSLAIRNFSWDNVAADTIKSYERIIGEKKMTFANSLKREKATFGLLCLLPFLAFLSLAFYSFSTVSRIILLAESGAFFLLLVLNTHLVGRWYKWWIIALNVASVAVTLFYHSGLGAAAAFFNLLIAIFIFNNLVLRIEQKRFLHFLSATLILLLFFASNFGKLYGEITMRDFGGFFLNPNVVGMLLFALLLHTFNFVSELKIEKKKKQPLLVLTVAVLGYLIYFTACRSALLALAFFLLLLLFGRLYKGQISYAFYKLVTVGILILSLAFTFAYVVLSDRLDDITLLGKSLFTGREIVWQSAFGLISESPLFGNGTDHLLATVGGEKTTSAHNTLLSIWYTLGVIPTATVTLFFVNRSQREIRCNRDRITVFALVSSTVICFFESFYADPTIGIFFELLLLSNVRSEK